MTADAVLTPEDDLFWLQRAGTIVNGTAEKLDAGAERLADAMAWFWTAYSAVALVTMTTTEITRTPVVALAVAAPSVFIFAAYLAATLAALPIQIEFDDRLPHQIKAAHDLAIARRRRRVNIGVGLACAAAAAVAVSVIVVTLERDESTSDTAAFSLNPDSSQVLAAGRLGDANTVIIQMVSPQGHVAERLVMVDNGEFDFSMQADEVGTYVLTATWASDGRVYSVTQEVEKQ